MDSEARAQFARLGVALDPVDPDRDEEEITEVFAGNWTSLSAFVTVATQWRVVATMGGLIWVGLDYPAVKMVLDHSGLPAPVFDDLRVMENAALAVLNEVD